MAQSATATVVETAAADETAIPASTSVPISPTAAPANQIASATVAAPVQATAGVTGTLIVTSTAAAGATAPLPTGTPPEPMSQLNMALFVPLGATLVKRDNVQLDDKDPNEWLFTVTGPGETITSERRSAIGAIFYDSSYWQWKAVWSSQVLSGTISPVLGAGQSAIGGLNGGDLLRTGAPILVVRSTLLDGRARLYMWRWNREKRIGEPLRMVPAGGGAERDAEFDADLDVSLADLDDDGVYEVVADNVAGMQVWKWDGSRYVPEGGQR